MKGLKKPPNQTTTLRSYGKSLTKEKNNNFVILMRYRLDSFYNQEIYNQILYYLLRLICSYTFAHPKVGWSNTKGFILFNPSRSKYWKIKAEYCLLFFSGFLVYKKKLKQNNNRIIGLLFQ